MSREARSVAGGRSQLNEDDEGSSMGCSEGAQVSATDERLLKWCRGDESERVREAMMSEGVE